MKNSGKTHFKLWAGGRRSSTRLGEVFTFSELRPRNKDHKGRRRGGLVKSFDSKTNGQSQIPLNKSDIFAPLTSNIAVRRWKGSAIGIPLINLIYCTTFVEHSRTSLERISHGGHVLAKLHCYSQPESCTIYRVKTELPHNKWPSIVSSWRCFQRVDLNRALQLLRTNKTA